MTKSPLIIKSQQFITNNIVLKIQFFINIGSKDLHFFDANKMLASFDKGHHNKKFSCINPIMQDLKKSKNYFFIFEISEYIFVQ